MTDVVSRNNVKVSGSGTQRMMLAHGFGCDQTMWRFVAPAFEADYRVILFDYVGSGKADVSAYDAERYATLDGYAQDVLDIVHALDLRDVIFVGHSVSSMVGVLAANREPSASRGSCSSVRRRATSTMCPTSADSSGRRSR